MAQQADEVFRAGLKLDPDDRVAVAQGLLASASDEADAAETEISSAWRDEIGTRLDQVLAGEVELTEFSTLRAEARGVLDDLRR